MYAFAVSSFGRQGVLGDNTTTSGGVTFWDDARASAMLQLLEQNNVQSADGAGGKFAKGIHASGFQADWLINGGQWARSRVADGDIVVSDVRTRSADQALASGDSDYWIGVNFWALDPNGPTDKQILSLLMANLGEQEIQGHTELSQDARDKLGIMGVGAAVLTGPPAVMAQLRGGGASTPGPGPGPGPAPDPTTTTTPVTPVTPSDPGTAGTSDDQDAGGQKSGPGAIIAVAALVAAAAGVAYVATRR
jgi:hypothetical protein